MKYFFAPLWRGHFVDQGDGLGLGGEQIVVAALVQKTQHIPGAGDRQLRVTEADKRADVKLVSDLADGQLAVQTGDGDGVNRHDTNLLFAAGGGRRPHMNSSAAGDAAQILYRKSRKCQPTYRQGAPKGRGNFAQKARCGLKCKSTGLFRINRRFARLFFFCVPFRQIAQKTGREVLWFCEAELAEFH